MSSKILELVQPEVKTLTHLKLCKIAVEIPRAGKPPYIEMWFAKTILVDGQWVEVPNEPGIQIKLDGPQYDAFSQIQLNIKSMADLESVIYGVCQQTGLLPAAQIVDY